MRHLEILVGSCFRSFRGCFRAVCRRGLLPASAEAERKHGSAAISTQKSGEFLRRRSWI